MAFAIRRGPKLTSLSTLVLLLFCVWFLVLIPFLSRHGGLSFRPQRPNRAPPIELVVASTKHENTTWVHQHLPEWSRKVYVVDDPQNALTVPVNKGREAMVFLTYLVDNYYSLPDTVVFVHASRFQWHNDDPDYDLLPELRNLNFTYVRTVGYANLRCVWVLGCPVEIRPFADELPAGQEPQPSGRRLTTKEIFKRAFEELLPDIPVPQEVGVSCCSQFAVTRETVRQRPLEDYVHFRQWLIDTPLTDDLSGRVLEYAWHSKSTFRVAFFFFFFWAAV